MFIAAVIVASVVGYLFIAGVVHGFIGHRVFFADTPHDKMSGAACAWVWPFAGMIGTGYWLYRLSRYVILGIGRGTRAVVLGVSSWTQNKRADIPKATVREKERA